MQYQLQAEFCPMMGPEVQIDNDKTSPGTMAWMWDSDPHLAMSISNERQQQDNNLLELRQDNSELKRAAREAQKQLGGLRRRIELMKTDNSRQSYAHRKTVERVKVRQNERRELLTHALCINTCRRLCKR
jgi:hypothetical protein